MKKRFNNFRVMLTVLTLGLSALAVADIPFFWLDKPKGRSNPADPSSPLFFNTATPSAPSGATNTPTQVSSPSYTFTPTQVLSATPTSTPTPVFTGTSTPTYAPATATPTFTPIPASCVTVGPGPLVADFENTNCGNTAWGVDLWVSVDGNGSTASPATWAAGSQVAPPGSGNATTRAACMSGTMVQENSGASIYPYTDLQLPLHASANQNVAPHSSNNGLSFRFRAAVAGVQYRVSLYQGFGDPYQIRFTPNNTNWNTYNVYFPGVSTSALKFAQPSWATPTAWTPSILRIDVGPVASATGTVAYDFCIDDVTFSVPTPPAPYPATKLLAAEYGIGTDEWGGTISANDVDGTSSINGSQGAGSDLVGGTPLGSFCINGTIGGGANPYAVGLMRLNAAGTAVDLGAISTNQSMKFSYKANVANIPYRIRIASPAITDYDFYHFDFTPTDTNWHEQVIYFPGTAPVAQCFAQGGWGAAVPWATVVSQIVSVDLMVYTPGGYDICIDDVDFNAPAGPGGGGPASWPTVYDGDNVALGTNYYMALTGSGQGGVVESSGTGAHGSSTFASVTLAATGYSGAAIFVTGFDVTGPTPQDAQSSTVYRSVELSVRIPATGGNCYPPAAKLVIANNSGSIKYNTKPVPLGPYLIEAGGSASGPAFLEPDVWYTARIPITAFLGDNGEVGPDNHVVVDGDLVNTHGVAVQPAQGSYSATGDFTGQIHVDDIKFVATTSTLSATNGRTFQIGDFEKGDGSSGFGTYWFVYSNDPNCDTRAQVINFPGTAVPGPFAVPISAGGALTSCNAGHLDAIMGNSNGCTGYAAMGFGLNFLDPTGPVNLGDNSFVPGTPTGLRMRIKLGPNSNVTAYIIKLKTNYAPTDADLYWQLNTADAGVGLNKTTYVTVNMPFPTVGGPTTAHTGSWNAGSDVTEAWWGSPGWATSPNFSLNGITGIEVGPSDHARTNGFHLVDIFVDDIEFY